MSSAVTYGDRVYLAGVVAGDTTADATGQTEQVLARIDDLLARAGTDKSKLLKANIWLADMADFGAMNAVWDAWVVPGETPARATVESRLATPAHLVEIMVEAVR